MGGSTIIIRHMHYKKTHRDIHLRRLVQSSQVLVKKYESIEFFQVPRVHNYLEYLKYSKDLATNVGKIRINKGEE